MDENSTQDAPHDVQAEEAGGAADEQLTQDGQAAEPEAAQAGAAAEQESAKAKKGKKGKKAKKPGFFKTHPKIARRLAIGFAVAVVVIAIVAVLAYKIPVLDQRGGDPSEYDIAEAGEWTDGTYTKQVDGKRRFSVTVTIEGGYMTDIDVSNNNETPGRGAVALPLLAEEALELQSADVPDVMTGVTLSTTGFKDAVYRCLEEASK